MFPKIPLPKGRLVMGASAREKRIAALKEEMGRIHIANQKYWTSRGEEHSREERAEHERRRIRLEQIGAELRKLILT